MNHTAHEIRHRAFLASPFNDPFRRIRNAVASARRVLRIELGCFYEQVQAGGDINAAMTKIALQKAKAKAGRETEDWTRRGVLEAVQAAGKKVRRVGGLDVHYLGPVRRCARLQCSDP